MKGWLFDTLLYTGALIALVLVLRRPVTRHFGPQIAYALWGLPFLRLLLPPVVLPASLAPEPVAAPLSALGAGPAAGEHWVEAASAAPRAMAYGYSPPPPQSAVSTLPAWDWAALTQLAIALWLASAAAFLGWRVVTYRRMRAELLADARPVGEIGTIRLVETPALAAPVAFGVFDKVIALPPLFMAQPDRMARDLAIQHELQHHRGNDLLANMAAQVLLALHWFNPLAWYGWRAMRRDQEAACDARVLAGRCRDERALYAALIVDIAAGPRLALAAPMACPVLGDKSVIHRLRSMSMAEVTPRRRWLGRGLIVGAATLALPLTASISYSVASAQGAGEPAAPAVAPSVPAALDAPAAPAAPTRGGNERHPATAVPRGGESGEPAHTFSLNGTAQVPMPPAPMPPMPPMPPMELRSWGDPEDPAFERQMEEWGEQLEKWGEEYGKQWEEWGAAQGAQALAWSETAARHAPEVIHSCDQAETGRTVTADGRPRIVICPEAHLRRASQAEAQAKTRALAGLRNARASVARNRGMGEQIRQEVLDDLDAEIRRMERGGE